VRIPPGQARRVALHIARHQNMRAEDFPVHVSDQPAGTDPAPSASRPAAASRDTPMDDTRLRRGGQNGTHLRFETGAHR
jgi:hypothetical protein